MVKSVGSTGAVVVIAVISYLLSLTKDSPCEWSRPGPRPLYPAPTAACTLASIRAIISVTTALDRIRSAAPPYTWPTRGARPKLAGPRKPGGVAILGLDLPTSSHHRPPPPVRGSSHTAAASVCVSLVYVYTPCMRMCPWPVCGGWARRAKDPPHTHTTPPPCNRPAM